MRVSSLVLKAVIVLFVQVLVLRRSRRYFAGYFCSSSVFYIRLLKVLFQVNFVLFPVSSSFSTGTASLSKTHDPCFHLSIVVCVYVCDRETRGDNSWHHSSDPFSEREDVLTKHCLWLRCALFPLDLF